MLLGYGMLLALLDYWVLGAANTTRYLVLLTLLGYYNAGILLKAIRY